MSQSRYVTENYKENDHDLVSGRGFVPTDLKLNARKYSSALILAILLLADIIVILYLLVEIKPIHRFYIFIIMGRKLETLV